MCGIAGYIVKKEKYKIKEFSGLLEKMADELYHRGPDDAGYYESETSQGGYHVGIAHRRLSIIDLNTGHQPIGNEDDSIQLVFNGEIYNYKELRDGLLDFGHTFKTSSDTETIVHAYEQYGEEFVYKIKGMFAIALWDSNNNKMILARDHFGKKPLFIYSSDDIVLFASEIKALTVSDNIKLSINKHAIWEYLKYRYVPGPETLLSNITKLNPGSIMIWNNGEISEKKYYFPSDKLAYTRKEQPANPVKLFREKLDHAVKIRMMSDVPFGAFLSGGIDSSAIVCFMAKHSVHPIKTFSVGFVEGIYSELGYARTIAKHFNTEHHELEVSSLDMIEELPKLIKFRDAPVSEPSDIPIYLLSKEASKHVKMVLTGEGSDEILGGYPKHVFERYAKYYQIFPNLIRYYIEQFIGVLPYKFRRAKTAISSLGLTSPTERLPRWFGALTDHERVNLTAFSALTGPKQSAQFDVEANASYLRKILYFDQMSWLPDNLLERGDRMTMAASIEGRMPFMDIDLAEYVSSLPDKFRVNKSITKWILREALKSDIPEEILNRPKVGFRVPVNEWFKGEMRDYLIDNLTGSNSETKSLYKPKYLNKIIEEHIKGRNNHEKLLWTLLNLELWHKLCPVKE